MLFLLSITVFVEVVSSLNYKDLYNNKYQRKINNQHNRRNDYMYNDWEETTQDYYALILSTANKTTESTTFSLVSLTSTAEVTSPLATTPSSSTETSLSSPSFATASSVADTTFTFASEFTTTVTTTDRTSEVLDVTTEKMFENFTIEATTHLPVDNHLIYEIRKIKQERREGDFTASLILLVQLAIAKDPGLLKTLLRGLNDEIMKTSHKFMIFGPTVVDKVTMTARMAASADVQQVRAQLEYMMYCLHNRRSSVYREVNAIIDVADNIYNEDDVRNVADAIRDFMNFPNTDKKPADISKELMEAFVLTPYKRIQGTTKERLFLMEVDYAVGKLLNAQTPMRRNLEETETPKTTEPTKSIMDLIIESKYVTNKKIMKRVKHRMMKYKHKRMKDKKLHLSRGITTTTVLTTTTKKVKMRKSKYYIRKYKKKNLRRRTTTTEKSTTTRDMFKYYGKIKKERHVGAEGGRRYIKKQPGSGEESDEDYYSDNDNVYDGDVSSETEETETKERHKRPFANTLAYNFGRRNAKSPDFEDEELKLKLKLRDAMIHSEHTNIGYRRALMERLKENRECDDELILKKNIYNAFGYKDKFNLA